MITSFCGKIIWETTYKLLLQLAYFYRRCLKKNLVCFLMGHSVYIHVPKKIVPWLQRPAIWTDTCILYNLSCYICCYLQTVFWEHRTAFKYKRYKNILGQRPRSQWDLQCDPPSRYWLLDWTTQQNPSNISSKLICSSRSMWCHTNFHCYYYYY